MIRTINNNLYCYKRVKQYSSTTIENNIAFMLLKELFTEFGTHYMSHADFGASKKEANNNKNGNSILK